MHKHTGTYTYERGYGFHVGVGTGQHNVTYGLPVTNTNDVH